MLFVCFILYDAWSFLLVLLCVWECLLQCGVVFLELFLERFNNTKYPQQLLSKLWLSFGDGYRIQGSDIYQSRPLNWLNLFD